MKQAEVKDVSAFVKFMSSIEGREIREGKLLFRGQSNISYELLPSIARDYNGKKQPLLSAEAQMIESAKNELPDVFRREYEPIEILALLQHYGMPTRLLDVTENALVGLYFACAGDVQEDGEVNVFCPEDNATRIRLLANAIADTHKIVKYEYESLENFYGNIRNQNYFNDNKYMMEMVHVTDADGADWLRHFACSPVFTYAPIHSTRQRVQSGKYIIFPNRIILEDSEMAYERAIDPMPKNHPCIVGRAIVKYEAKQRILYELSLMGITKKTLFQDSIDVVCQEIKSSYLK